MKNAARLHVSLALGLWLAASARGGELESYVAAKDDAYAWSIHKTEKLPLGVELSIVKLTSQRWQGIVWEHWIYLIRPDNVTRPDIGLLVVSGGGIKKTPPTRAPSEALMLASVAVKMGTSIAVLTQVPNQPLFGNLKEDALIAYTFQKFLETKDPTWPCLLPMTKSAVRAMDALQEIARQSHKEELKQFVVTGASKRGWTTWLTGAVDPRVVAIAPMVIDTLNMPKQMPHQVLSFGKYSEEIEDYTRLDLPGRIAEPSSQALMAIVDPYAYRAKLTMPKLVVLGTNDRYWPVDAVKLYFPELVGEKLIHHMPNAGHGLGLVAIETVMAFFEMVVAGEKRPRFTWSQTVEGKDSVLTVTAGDAPLKAEFWRADSGSRDFREAKWEAQEFSASATGSFTRRMAMPPEGFVAYFARLAYKNSSGRTYHLCTNVEVLGEKAREAKKDAPAAVGGGAGGK